MRYAFNQVDQHHGKETTNILGSADQQKKPGIGHKAGTQTNRHKRRLRHAHKSFKTKRLYELQYFKQTEKDRARFYDSMTAWDNISAQSPGLCVFAM